MLEVQMFIDAAAAAGLWRGYQQGVGVGGGAAV